MPIRIEAAAFPLVIVRWQGINSDAEVAAYLSAMTEVVRRPQRKVIIYDALQAAIPTSTHRRMQGEWLKQNQSVIERLGAGTAFVLESAIMRGALTAVFWISPVPNGHVVTASVEEALAWARARLHDAPSTTAP